MTAYTKLERKDSPIQSGSIFIVGTMAMTITQLTERGYRQHPDGTWSIRTQ